MNLPQLPREPIRPDLEGVEADRELWHPKWRCFCCRDIGLININLVRLVIPSYDNHRDKPVVCQNPHCEAGADYRSNANYDQRFTAFICGELDKRSREDWKHTILSQCELIQNRNRIKEAALRMSMRQRDRTLDEEVEAQRRHEEILNADPVELKKMARAYLGKQYMKEGPL